MTTIERMREHRKKLLAEVQELDSALAVMERFKAEPATVKPRIVKPAERRGQAGRGKALKNACRDAIIKHGRPVTHDEVLEEVKKYGFTINQWDASCGSNIFPEFSGAGRGVKPQTIWYKGRPRPEPEEWQKQLKEAL